MLFFYKKAIWSYFQTLFSIWIFIFAFSCVIRFETFALNINHLQWPSSYININFICLPCSPYVISARIVISTQQIVLSLKNTYGKYIQLKTVHVKSVVGPLQKRQIYQHTSNMFMVQLPSVFATSVEKCLETEIIYFHMNDESIILNHFLVKYVANYLVIGVI